MILAPRRRRRKSPAAAASIGSSTFSCPPSWPLSSPSPSQPLQRGLYPRKVAVSAASSVLESPCESGRDFPSRTESRTPPERHCRLSHRCRPHHRRRRPPYRSRGRHVRQRQRIRRRRRKEQSSFLKRTLVALSFCFPLNDCIHTTFGHRLEDVSTRTCTWNSKK